jgi:WD40 repeat protein/energy-coupling factor transporter ATP-binding protein EcfA2
LVQGGVDVWLDVDQIAPGDFWMDELETALLRATSLIVYVGPSGVRDWVGREIRVALDRSTREPRFRLIPLLGPGADVTALPLFLTQHQWLDMRDGVDPVPKLKRLLGAVTGRNLSQISLLGPNQSPFRGLFAFEQDDALLFYGRDWETDQLVNKLALNRFLAVVGDSGSGKSSLVKAGLIPALHGGRLALATGDTASWRVCVARAGDPFRELAEALPKLKPEIGEAAGTAFVAEAKKQMATGMEGLRNALAGLQIDGRTRVLVVIDQFEELFTAGVGKEEQLRYIGTLLAAVPDGIDHRWHVAITLRADFYSQCWAHPDLPKRIAENQFAVQRMGRQLREVIEKPLAQAGVRAEAGLVDRLLNDVGDEPGSLPLLEHTLDQLWGECAGGVITNAAYEKIGGLKGSLRNYADQVYKELEDEKNGATARKILVRLTQFGEGSQDTRRRATKSELLAASGSQRQAEQVLNKLVSARLVTVGTEQQTRQDVLEVAHETLIREWPLLRGWVNEDRQDLRVERSILQAAKEWEGFGRDSGALLKGAKLAQAEEWSVKHPGELPGDASEFLRRSVAARDEEAEDERDRQREKIANAERLSKEAEARALSEARAAVAARKSATRIRWFSAALAVLLLGTAGLAWWAQRQRAIAESRLLAAQAQRNLDVDSAESLRLAIRAAHYYKTEEAEVALNAALGLARSRIIFHHGGPVSGVAFSPDGKRVVTASSDDTARVWDAVSGRLVAALAGHRGVVNIAAFLPDGQRVVTASEDRTAQVWDAQSGRSLAALTGHQGPVYTAAFSPDGKRVVTASDDSTARVWDARSGRGLATLIGHHGPVYTAAFSPDGKRVVTASDDNTARVWDAESGRALAVLTGHLSSVLTAAFAPDGKRVVTTASYDETARVWDAENGRALATLTGHRGPVYTAAFSADGKQVVTASQDATARVWDAEGGRVLATLTGHQESVRTAAFSPDGRRVVTASDDNTARVWDSRSGRVLATLSGHQDAVVTAAFSSDGKRVVTASNDNTARVWDSRSGRVLATLSGHQDVVVTASFSPDGKRVVTASSDDTARVWDAVSGRLVAALAGHRGVVNIAAFLPDGQRVVTASEDRTAQVWDAQSGRSLAALTGHQGPVYTAAFSPDGKRVVTASEDKTARLWDVGSGRLLATLNGHKSVVHTAAFSPDGKRVVTASEDKTARLWDTVSGQALATMTGHQGSVQTAVFSPDSKRVVTASSDHTARVWDARSGQALATLAGHQGVVWTAAFSRDGKRVVTASSDHTALVYIIDLDDLLTWAERLFPMDSR